MSTSRVIIQQQEFNGYKFRRHDFDLSYWQSHGNAEYLAGGRGASLKILLQDQQLVLRQYLRGGLMARWLRDQYLWTGLENSRPYREQRVSLHALDQGLPVADVIAYCVCRKGLYYRAAIITGFIPNRGTLAELCARDGLPRELWAELGGLIRKLHASGINHADLNANNILYDDKEGFHLIDFDKARIESSPGAWVESNIKRLKRSLDKIAAGHLQSNETFHFSQTEWQAFLGAYR